MGWGEERWGEQGPQEDAGDQVMGSPAAPSHRVWLSTPKQPYWARKHLGIYLSAAVWGRR